MAQALIVKIFILHYYVLGLSLAMPTMRNFENYVSVTAADDTVSVEAAADNSTSIRQEDDEPVIDLRSLGRAMYGFPDTQITGVKLTRYNFTNNSVNPEELGPYLEGDILIPYISGMAKNGVIEMSSRWPKGIIPFDFEGNFTASEYEFIRKAIQVYHDNTCIRFVPHTTERDYIVFNNSKSGCWASVGRLGGMQVVNLQSGPCTTKPGTPIHELMHVVGFLHEQNRQERDDYVIIKFENIKERAVPNFAKTNSTVAYGVPYDYGSVMHYSPRAFSTNGKPTIIAKRYDLNTQRMGQRDGFSLLDIQKINRMYNCFGLKADNYVKKDQLQISISSPTAFKPARKQRTKRSTTALALKLTGRTKRKTMRSKPVSQPSEQKTKRPSKLTRRTKRKTMRSKSVSQPSKQKTKRPSKPTRRPKPTKSVSELSVLPSRPTRRNRSATKSSTRKSKILRTLRPVPDSKRFTFYINFPMIVFANNFNGSQFQWT